MSARPATKPRPAEPRKMRPPATVATVKALPRVDDRAEEQAKHRRFGIFGDPLWGMAIASVILFATLAALIAIG